MDLDEPEHFGTVDRSDALGVVLDSWRQWQEAGLAADVCLDTDLADVVVVTGMGGSGITGDIVRAIAAGRSRFPVVVHKGYGVPDFVGPRTLVVSVSYSGETEETLSAFVQAKERRAALFAVSSGGELARLCEEDGVPHVLVPGGGQPRHSLGYLLVPVLVALSMEEGLAEAVEVLAAIAEDLGPDVQQEGNPAKQMAVRLAEGGIPLLVGAAGIAAVAGYRAQCQLNENAKQRALSVELPEACHNEIVAWQAQSDVRARGGVVELRDAAAEHPRVARRSEILAELLAPNAAWLCRVHATGSSTLARLASLIMQVDLISIYTALALDRDPTPIENIRRLKAALATT